jgi:hypothetical protein
LVVTLSNTSKDDVVVPTDVLTGVFFTLNGVSLLSRVSAEINPTGVNTVVYGTAPSDRMVGGEWAYKNGIAAPHGATMGISAVGLDLFGPRDRFPGPDLDGQINIGGLSWGLTSMGDKPDTGNGGVDKQPLIMYSVVFTLSGLPPQWTVDKITDVSFQYGTGLDEPNIPEGGGGGGGFETVPEPGTFVLFGMGLAGLAVIRRRRNR